MSRYLNVAIHPKPKGMGILATNFIKGQIQDVVVGIPDIHFPDIEKRLEKLEDFKEDFERGWIKK